MYILFQVIKCQIFKIEFKLFNHIKSKINANIIIKLNFKKAPLISIKQHNPLF